MSLSPQKIAELQDLVAQFCNEDLNRDAFERLAALLEGDMEAQKLYVRYLDMHQSLRELAIGLNQCAEMKDIQAILAGLVVLGDHTGPSSTAGEQQLATNDRLNDVDTVGFQTPTIPVPLSPLSEESHSLAIPNRSSSVLSFLTSRAMGWTLCALLLTAMIASVTRREDERSSNLGEVAQPKFAAPPDAVPKAAAPKVVASQIAMGKPFGVSSVQLNSGTANLTLPGVGYVIVDGPAKFDLIDPMRARLNTGRIKMHVTEESGHGFVVETPYGNVTDLGTEFGLDVPVSGQAGLVVFDGAVDLRVKQKDQAVDFARVERLVRGEGVQFGKEGQTDRIMSIITGTVPTFQRHRHADEDGFLHPILAVGDNLRNSETRKFYEIVPGGLCEDAVAYVDRPTHQWNGLTVKGMPSYLAGADYVKTFNNDKMNNSTEIEIMLRGPARLFVFYDDRLKVPGWLRENFRRNGDKIGMDLGLAPRTRLRSNGVGPGVSVNLRFSIWERLVTESGIIRLGPSLASNASRSSMYGIAAVALDSDRTQINSAESSDTLPAN